MLFASTRCSPTASAARSSGPRAISAGCARRRWDSGSVFSSLIGGSGVYAIWPADRFTWGGYYEPRLADLAQPVGDRRGQRLPSAGRRSPFPAIASAGPAAPGYGLHGYRAGPRPACSPGPNTTGGRCVRAAQDEAGNWTGRAGDLYLRWSGDVGRGDRYGPAGCRAAGPDGARRRGRPRGPRARAF